MRGLSARTRFVLEMSFSGDALEYLMQSKGDHRERLVVGPPATLSAGDLLAGRLPVGDERRSSDRLDGRPVYARFRPVHQHRLDGDDRAGCGDLDSLPEGDWGFQ
jgi:hypothetical protein